MNNPDRTHGHRPEVEQFRQPFITLSNCAKCGAERSKRVMLIERRVGGSVHVCRKCPVAA